MFILFFGVEDIFDYCICELVGEDGFVYRWVDICFWVCRNEYVGLENRNFDVGVL